MSENVSPTRVSRDADSRRRRELLAAARTVFEAKGFGAATVADFTALAGVSRPAFYLYFASKKDVFVALAEQVGETFRAAQDIRTADYDDVEMILRTTIATTFDVTIEHLALMAVLDHESIAEPEIAQIWEPIRRRGMSRTTRYLRSQVERGAISPVVDAASLALMGTGMIEAFASPVVSGRMSREEAIADMYEVWKAAIGGFEERP